MTTPTKEQILAALRTVQALAETIRELGSVPAGTLYSAVMSKMSLETFDRAIGTLTKTGLVERQDSHLLVWKGPKA